MKTKDILIWESYHKLNPNIHRTICEFECGVAFDQWVPNVSEVSLGVLIIDFVRWPCGPWVAFSHWCTYLTYLCCLGKKIRYFQ
jgi:hypothetical protein